MGPLALKLECLVYRDGLTFDEACGVLRSDPRVAETPEALHAIYTRLPQRVPQGRASAALEPAVPGQMAAERFERQALAQRTFAVIRETLARQAPCDRLFLKLHLESAMTVAEASRALGVGQKSLYRRKDELLKCLRGALALEGIGEDEAHELLSSLDWDAALNFEGDEAVLTPENA